MDLTGRTEKQKESQKRRPRDAGEQNEKNFDVDDRRHHRLLALGGRAGPRRRRYAAGPHGSFGGQLPGDHRGDSDAGQHQYPAGRMEDHRQRRLSQCPALRRHCGDARHGYHGLYRLDDELYAAPCAYSSGVHRLSGTHCQASFRRAAEFILRAGHGGQLYPRRVCGL